MAVSKLGRLYVGDGYPVRVISVINLSPESFYGPSIAKNVDEAITLALRHVEEGADVIDVGAMSTAPYKTTWIPPEVEEERLLPALRELVENVDVPISVDTYRPKIVEKALSIGAEIVNDVTGLKLYPETCNIVRDYGASIVVVARERAPAHGLEPVVRIVRALEESLAILRQCGVEPDRIAVDPGVGFPLLPEGDKPYRGDVVYRHGDREWPWWKWDLHVIANVFKLKSLGRPVVVGVSRKSFLWEVLKLSSPEEALYGSIAAEAVAVFNGANAVRTHNPKEAKDAVRVAEEMRKHLTSFPP